MNDARKKAWETRRAKYGPRGHASSYSTGHLRQSEARFTVELARQSISQARRQCQILLPDFAAHKAITRLDIADELLARTFAPTFSDRILASCDTRPEGGDAPKIAAPSSTSGAVPNEDSAGAQRGSA